MTAINHRRILRIVRASPSFIEKDGNTLRRWDWIGQSELSHILVSNDEVTFSQLT